MHANYEVSVSYGSKDTANVKFNNRQTDIQTGQKYIAMDHLILGHNSSNYMYVQVVVSFETVRNSCFEQLKQSHSSQCSLGDGSSLLKIKVCL